MNHTRHAKLSSALEQRKRKMNKNIYHSSIAQSLTVILVFMVYCIFKTRKKLNQNMAGCRLERKTIFFLKKRGADIT